MLLKWCDGGDMDADGNGWFYDRYLLITYLDYNKNDHDANGNEEW